MVHKTEVMARCRRLGRIRGARLEALARPGSGASAYSGSSAVAVQAPAPAPTSTSFSCLDARLLDTPCRV